MKIVLDIEANDLEEPTKIWVIVCKDIDTGDLHIFRGVCEDEKEKDAFLAILDSAELVVGHNILEYDIPHVCKLLHLDPRMYWSKCLDTLILSRLIDYSQSGGHSIEGYGERFGYLKGIPIEGELIEAKHIPQSFFWQYSKEMEDYCVRDVEICHRIYSLFRDMVDDPSWHDAIKCEHQFQWIVNSLHTNGFAFNSSSATSLLASVEAQLKILDEKLLEEFPPKEVLIREFTPRATKYGTISKSSVPVSLRKNIEDYEIGHTYRQVKLVPFNPASVKQVVTVLNEAGWKPVDKTQAHLELLREWARLKRTTRVNSSDFPELYEKREHFNEFGWKINEKNLSTLPEDAPSPARTLASRIMLESRRRSLIEWLGLVKADDRIHGKFVGIGAWTHRMAHQKPNTANIPTERKLLGKEMRQLWCAPRNKLLIGVDAEGIQLRIFAHYINDPEFTKALVEGKKEDRSDPHSLNQRILGPDCRSRDVAKRFIYALLLGAGLSKLAELLGVSKDAAKVALDRLLERYQGFAYLKNHVIPQDAERGFFVGLDGRAVKIPGEDADQRAHLAMSGYLQNGEGVIMKRACLLWHKQLEKLNVTREANDNPSSLHSLDDFPVHSSSELQAIQALVPNRPGARVSQIQKTPGWMIVNFVHDEWQTECVNDFALALEIARAQADSFRVVGQELKLRCPLAGSFWNEDHKDYTIGTDWYHTH